jgi:hypothetical protein
MRPPAPVKWQGGTVKRGRQDVDAPSGAPFMVAPRPCSSHERHGSDRTNDPAGRADRPYSSSHSTAYDSPTVPVWRVLHKRR